MFDISESDYIRYQRLFLSGSRPSERGDTVIPVRIRLADEADWTRTGKIDFVAVKRVVAGEAGASQAA